MRNVARAMLWMFLVVMCVTATQAAGDPQAGGTQGQPALQVDRASIGGTVVNNGKPEAGVWVIAETKLGVPFRKIVVTDDRGRFLVPDLPAASYDVWVRGYGLKDSAKTKAERGAEVKLQVAKAATPQEAAKIFDPKKETFTVFRLPYPMPFYTRGLDGRIDDPRAGWKGRGIWTSYNSYLPKFTETKLGYVNHIQLRPNPLAN